MFDCYNRQITYLRVSVTDRCNHRCVYCMPPEGVPLKRHDQILSYEQIAAVVRAAVALGIRKVRLTGGEPLVRRGIVDLVGMLSRIDGIAELCLTTNGTYLDGLAAALKGNGLTRVNVSINTLDPERYRQITRGGDLAAALRGVDAAVRHGLIPVKINMVIFPDTTEAAVAQMQAYCARNGFELQRILQFNLHDRNDFQSRREAERPPPCAACNRLRLTADGYLMPCLFSEHEVKVDFGNIRGSLLDAVALKPERGTGCGTRSMCQIGG